LVKERERDSAQVDKIERKKKEGQFVSQQYPSTNNRQLNKKEKKKASKQPN
jgi:hypothetical protein